ncbi:hypothetical protein K2173_027568 [Erythroxylum novogranatense]|uniref:Phytocyanin domain-containing protein n=1 Tax=Erythroxylum novogranatense TaxID=1862640 RepID=A0AAV8TZF0_9ROSI|nr:hypothetical protein K2173_027568 [Erythroxylum novogranatense]
MPNLVLVSFLLGLSFALACNAATYLVGDTSGWDISTNIDWWAQDKTFAVGDLLLFLYSPSHSLDEVTKDGFGSCNTSNVLRTFMTGNTTVLLISPGSRYFVCGNKLHCLGGLRLHVHVQGNQANSPVAAPQAQPQPQPRGSTQPSFKNNNPVLISAGFLDRGRIQV